MKGKKKGKKTLTKSFTVKGVQEEPAPQELSKVVKVTGPTLWDDTDLARRDVILLGLKGLIATFGISPFLRASGIETPSVESPSEEAIRARLAKQGLDNDNAEELAESLGKRPKGISNNDGCLCGCTCFELCECGCECYCSCTCDLPGCGCNCWCECTCTCECLCEQCMCETCMCGCSDEDKVIGAHADALVQHSSTADPLVQSNLNSPGSSIMSQNGNRELALNLSHDRGADYLNQNNAVSQATTSTELSIDGDKSALSTNALTRDIDASAETAADLLPAYQGDGEDAQGAARSSGSSLFGYLHAHSPFRSE